MVFFTRYTNSARNNINVPHVYQLLYPLLKVEPHFPQFEYDYTNLSNSVHTHDPLLRGLYNFRFI